jgi:hypothetical protein
MSDKDYKNEQHFEGFLKNMFAVPPVSDPEHQALANRLDRIENKLDRLTTLVTTKHVKLNGMDIPLIGEKASPWGSECTDPMEDIEEMLKYYG